MKYKIYADGDVELPVHLRFTTKDGRDLAVSFGGETAARFSYEDPKFIDTFVEIYDGSTRLIWLRHEDALESCVIACGLTVGLARGKTGPLNGECVVLTVRDSR